MLIPTIILDGLSGDIEIWLPVPPEAFAVVVGGLIVFMLIWLWKLVVSLLTGA